MSKEPALTLEAVVVKSNSRKRQHAPLIEKRCPAVARIKPQLEKMSDSERQWLLKYIESRPDLFGGVRVLATEDYARMRVQMIDDVVTIARMEDKGKLGSGARKQRAEDRNKAIDAAFDAKITKRGMYRFMCENHSELLPARKKKNGKKDPFMTEEKMWESYYNYRRACP